MAIGIMSLIVGIVAGVLLIAFIYYGVYYLDEKYAAVRHPFKKSPTPSAEPTNLSTASLSKSINVDDGYNEKCPEDRVSFIGLLETTASASASGSSASAMCVVIDETGKKLILAKINNLDSSQKWMFIFQKNNADPLSNNGGFIYNLKMKKYIFFDGNNLNLVDGNFIGCRENFIIGCFQDSDKISNLQRNAWLSLEGNNITITTDRKKSINFSITK
jgi:hypothetical protein